MAGPFTFGDSILDSLRNREDFRLRAESASADTALRSRDLGLREDNLAIERDRLKFDERKFDEMSPFQKFIMHAQGQGMYWDAVKGRLMIAPEVETARADAAVATGSVEDRTKAFNLQNLYTGAQTGNLESIVNERDTLLKPRSRLLGLQGDDLLSVMNERNTLLDPRKRLIGAQGDQIYENINETVLSRGRRFRNLDSRTDLNEAQTFRSNAMLPGDVEARRLGNAGLTLGLARDHQTFQADVERPYLENEALGISNEGGILDNYNREYRNRMGKLNTEFAETMDPYKRRNTIYGYDTSHLQQQEGRIGATRSLDSAKTVNYLEPKLQRLGVQIENTRRGLVEGKLTDYDFAVAAVDMEEVLEETRLLAARMPDGEQRQNLLDNYATMSRQYAELLTETAQEYPPQFPSTGGDGSLQSYSGAKTSYAKAARERKKLKKEYEKRAGRRTGELEFLKVNPQFARFSNEYLKNYIAAEETGY